MVELEKVVGDDLIVVLCRVGKAASAIAVAQGPDARHVGLQLIVSEDVAAMLGSHSGLVKAQVVGIGSATRGEKRVIA